MATAAEGLRCIIQGGFRRQTNRMSSAATLSIARSNSSPRHRLLWGKASFVPARRGSWRSGSSGMASCDRSFGTFDANHAFVFVKPHAMTSAVREAMPRMLSKSGVTVKEAGILDASEIRSRGCVDRHYATIARVALMSPDDLLAQLDSVARVRFSDIFGECIRDIAAAGRLLNLPDAIVSLGLTAEELKTRFNMKPHRIAHGTYVALLDGKYVVNGFYERIREKFTKEGAAIAWYAVEFQSRDLSWKFFRHNVIGITDPSRAATGSLRAWLLADWGVLGLPGPPDLQDNGIHASAGPLEALKERSAWCNVDFAEDPFGRQLISQLGGEKPVSALLDDTWIRLPGNREGRAFDLFEDVNTSEVLELLGDGCQVTIP